jgi:hypothetical protein
MILPVYDGSREYDRDARKAWADGRCRWHVSDKCDMRRANVGHPGAGRLTLPLSALGYGDQSTHLGATSRLSLDV